MDDLKLTFSGEGDLRERLVLARACGAQVVTLELPVAEALAWMDALEARERAGQDLMAAAEGLAARALALTELVNDRIDGATAVGDPAWRSVLYVALGFIAYLLLVAALT